MIIRIRQIFGSTKWVVELKVSCCQWMMIDPQNLEPRIPIMPYEDWFKHDSEESAQQTLNLYVEKKNK